jgi:Type I phosphodiesterase / nucleotide pyrophosphatase
MRGCLGIGGSTTQQFLRVLPSSVPPNRKRRYAQKRTTSVTALVLMGMTLCLLSSCRMALTLVTQGGEQQLREAVPPASSGPRVLIFALDGAGYNELMRAIRSGKAPHLQTLLGTEQQEGRFAHGYGVPNAISILPSTTMAAWSSIFTGQPPAQTGVPGNEWFVREQRQFFAPGPVSITDTGDNLKMLTEGLVGNALQTPTLYELVGLHSHVSLAPVYRGATLFTTIEPTAFVDLMAKFVTGVVNGTSVNQALYAVIDQDSVATLITALKEHDVPILQVVYFPGIDLFTHEAEEHLEADEPLPLQVEYLQSVTDKAIGEVLNAYEELGALDETYILLIADHGHIPVLDDDRHALGSEGDHEPPALLAQTGFRLRPFVLNPAETEQDYQAAVAYQGAMAYIYLADRSTCPAPGDPCDWQRPPRLEADVMPVVRAFYQVNETGEPIPQLKGTLDLIFAREPHSPGQNALPFQVFDGNKLVPIPAYLARHPRPDLLQLDTRMRWLSAGPYGHRAGDILLLARSGLERPIEERFYFSHPYRSWHGSPTLQDSHIPFILARKGDTGQRLQAIVKTVVGKSPSQLDFVPLVRALIGTNREPAVPNIPPSHQNMPTEVQGGKASLPRAKKRELSGNPTMN